MISKYNGIASSLPPPWNTFGSFALRSILDWEERHEGDLTLTRPPQKMEFSLKAIVYSFHLNHPDIKEDQHKIIINNTSKSQERIRHVLVRWIVMGQLILSSTNLILNTLESERVVTMPRVESETIRQLGFLGNVTYYVENVK